MFVMTVPSFADRLAPVPTTHNKTTFFIVSFLALAVNLIAVIYQFNLARKNKKNLLKDELYTQSKAYQQVTAENK